MLGANNVLHNEADVMAFDMEGQLLATSGVHVSDAQVDLPVEKYLFRLPGLILGHSTPENPDASVKIDLHDCAITINTEEPNHGLILEPYSLPSRGTRTYWYVHSDQGGSIPIKDDNQHVFDLGATYQPLEQHTAELCG